jgi:transcriptional regulator with XRE-family HTH domain
MSLGDKLKAKRLQLGINQAEFARKLGFDNNGYVSDIENNKYAPKEEKLRQWAKELGMTWDEMQDLLLEAELEDLGISDPAFTMMFKDIPAMNNEEKQAIIRTYQAVLRARESKRK